MTPTPLSFSTHYRHLQVNSLQTQFSSDFSKLSFGNFTVSGQATGLYKSAGAFTYVRFFGAGHEVPAYQFGALQRGQAALQMFERTMANQSISDTPLPPPNQGAASAARAAAGVRGAAIAGAAVIAVLGALV